MGSSKCVCLWDLMDFSQHSDKPILCGVQNAFIVDSHSDSAANWWPQLLSKIQGKAHLKWTFMSKQRQLIIAVEPEQAVAF